MLCYPLIELLKIFTLEHFLKKQVLVPALCMELSSSTLSLTKPHDFESYFFSISGVQPNSTFTVVLHESNHFSVLFL